MREIELAQNNLIFKARVGSFLYGVNNQDSDEDIYGIFIPSKEYLYGLHKCDQVQLNNEYGFTGNHLTKVKVDETIYSLNKFIQLAMANNPNIISMLYIPEHCQLFINDFGKELLENRHLFLSKKAYHTFRGYAHAQKKKILTSNPIGKRKELVDKHGFDVKFSYHLIRLLYEALDIFTIGELVYPCPHKEYLKKIRQGEVSMDEIFSEAERIEKLVDESYVRSNIQHSADRKSIEKLQMNLFERAWG